MIGLKKISDRRASRVSAWIRRQLELPDTTHVVRCQKCSRTIVIGDEPRINSSILETKQQPIQKMPDSKETNQEI